jgi:hypothetical protein
MILRTISQILPNGYKVKQLQSETKSLADVSWEIECSDLPWLAPAFAILDRDQGANRTRCDF